LLILVFGFRYKRPAVTLLLLLSLAASAFAAGDGQIARKLAALEKIEDKFVFVVLGDSRTGDDVYRRIAAMAMERKPRFVVHTGDMLEKPGRTKMWANFWRMSRRITVPYFLARGNHDAKTKTLFSDTEKTYKEQVDHPGNELYYSFIAGNSLFVVLDSFEEGSGKRISGEQYAWLEKVLADSEKRHTFVFLHHPLYTEPGKGGHAGDCLDKYPEDRDRLQALFVKHRVTAVFSGHEHLYQRMTVDDVTHIITGGGGAPLYVGEKDGGFHHFVVVTVEGDTVSAEVVDIGGRVRDRF